VTQRRSVHGERGNYIQRSIQPIKALRSNDVVRCGIISNARPSSHDGTTRVFFPQQGSDSSGLLRSLKQRKPVRLLTIESRSQM